MPKLNINRSIEINAPVEKIHNTLNDFSQWSPWSPWLICEPEAKVTVADDKKYYEWEGNRVGAGNMKVTNEEANKSIDYDLTFLKPWKSEAKVRFELNGDGEKTKVTWYMDSSLPWFMFWMKKMTEAFIGMDYERGLNMLKEYIEDGNVRSKLEFIGRQTFEGYDYIGIKDSCNMDTIDTKMSEDMETLAELSNKEGLDMSKAFAMFHKWDMVKRHVEYTVGVPSANGTTIPTGMHKGNIPKTKTYTLRHIGPYLHLGNAWTTMHMMMRNKEFKAVKSIHPFETFGNDPKTTPEEELITDIHFAVK